VRSTTTNERQIFISYRRDDAPHPATTATKNVKTADQLETTPCIGSRLKINTGGAAASQKSRRTSLGFAFFQEWSESLIVALANLDSTVTKYY
jgi:hypothetical protein